jgi:hypothetical protein
MFRLLKFVIVLGLGAFLGFKAKELLMKTECTAGDGQWTGTICMDSGVSQ